MAFHLLVINSKGTSGSSLAFFARGIYIHVSAGLVFALDNLAIILAVERLGVLGKHAMLRLCVVLFIGLLEHFRFQNPAIFPAYFAENNVDQIRI